MRWPMTWPMAMTSAVGHPHTCSLALSCIYLFGIFAWSAVWWWGGVVVTDHERRTHAHEHNEQTPMHSMHDSPVV